MMIGMLVAGIGCLLAGLLAIGFGIPINEFGLGNTLILAGSVAACSGLIILSMWVAVRELKRVAGQPGASPALDSRRNASPAAALPRPPAAENDITSPYGDPSGGIEPPGVPTHAPSPASWTEESEAPPSSVAEAPPKPRRNLMFSSTSRRDVEPRAAAAPAPALEVDEAPPANFDDAWPKSERIRPSEALPPRRPARSPSVVSDQAASRQPLPVEAQSPVTVLKSGVVDGMAYSLYSDGSIEAQMPEGMMRFASIDELRAHLDQRP